MPGFRIREIVGCEMKDCMVSILGTEYNIHVVEKFPEHMSQFEENSDGLCNSYNREIYVKIPIDKDITEIGKERMIKKNLRHEIYHAFLFESGLSSNTYGHMGAWAEHEEMVDWHAIQSPKIHKIFSELDLL